MVRSSIRCTVGNVEFSITLVSFFENTSNSQKFTKICVALVATIVRKYLTNKLIKMYLRKK